ncbi:MULTISPECIES: WXG100 family type VII secretion target [Cellulomonas]|uniref:WXG100 family type VII secretion target n=2 Tax=Cellulomonas TaxID=1707 RepID=A0ABR8QIH3_9CELL|nr:MULTISPECIES: WXG100 family type VII secretion target [Cellulomonas]MBD7920242.1 WXG100 family type VII secretion target [Cellulomonas avistercoris]MBO3089352.1 WXG100 family type VII secretion target [Cellulomonas dongxiuzhuiae]MBO3094862.1 WXG100 family type VII secretion target [Cellulomonas dongxiuzhuiae]QWC15895.1 WXG100 family type VII secretion target [Cellulomonas dongxiuzhuiae]
MPNLNITYADMSDSASRLRSNKAEVDARLSDTKSLVNSLVASGFVTDQASVRFDEVNTEFVTAANELMTTLESLSSWLDQAVTALQDVDTQMASSLRS